MTKPFDTCGHFGRKIDPTPIIMAGALLGVAEHQGDDFVCLTHLNEFWARDTIHPQALINAYQDYKELRAEGYELKPYYDPETREVFCKATWADGVFAIGAIVTYDPECDCCND